jgi:hypothetical protein
MLFSHARRSGDEEGRASRLMPDPSCCPVMQEGQEMRKGGPADWWQIPHIVQSCRKVKIWVREGQFTDARLRSPRQSSHATRLADVRQVYNDGSGRQFSQVFALHALFCAHASKPSGYFHCFWMRHFPAFVLSEYPECNYGPAIHCKFVPVQYQI